MSSDDLYLNSAKALALDILCFFDAYTDEEQLAKLKERLQKLEDKGKPNEWTGNYVAHFYEELFKEKKLDPLFIAEHIFDSLTEKQIDEIWRPIPNDEVFHLHAKMHEAYIKASLGSQKSVIGEKPISNVCNGITSNKSTTNVSEGTSEFKFSTNGTSFKQLASAMRTKKPPHQNEMPIELTKLDYYSVKKAPRLQINATDKNDLIMKRKLSLSVPKLSNSTPTQSDASNENVKQPETEEKPKNLLNLKTTDSDDLTTLKTFIDEAKEYEQFENGINSENRDVSNKYITSMLSDFYRGTKYIRGGLYLATEEPIYCGTTSGFINTPTPPPPPPQPQPAPALQTPVYTQNKREAAFLYTPPPPPTQIFIDMPIYYNQLNSNGLTYLAAPQQLSNIALGSYQQNSTGFTTYTELPQLVPNTPNFNKNRNSAASAYLEISQPRSNMTMHYGPHQHASRFTVHPITFQPNRVPPGFEHIVPSCNIVDINAGGDNVQNELQLEFKETNETN